MRRAILGAAVAALLIGAPAVLAQTQSAPPAAATTAKTKKPPSAGQQAMRERQKKCGAEWKAAKAAGKIEKGMTWPKYWSACNKRLKAGG
jgi:hypothetical protein